MSRPQKPYCFVTDCLFLAESSAFQAVLRTTYRFLCLPSVFCGKLRMTATALMTITMHRAKILQYAHGLSISMNVSASLNAGTLLKTTANVLFVQCISMVSFNEPVL